MSNLSFFDKIKILGDVISSSSIYIISLVVLVIIGLLFITTNKKNYKSSAKVYTLMYLAILLFVIVTYQSSIGKMFDYMMNNFFIAVYFPNLAIYLAAIIATNIITWISMFNFKISKIIKSINIIIFCIIHYFLMIILNIITNKKLDVFTQTSVYSNKQILAIIELSSIIFVLWIVFLVVYNIIRKIVNKKEKINNEQISNKNKLSENIIKINTPYVVKSESQNTKNNNNNMYDNLLTLDDYKLLISILNEKKQKDKEEERRKKEIDDQSKFFELQALYKSIDNS